MVWFVVNRGFNLTAKDTKGYTKDKELILEIRVKRVGEGDNKTRLRVRSG
jgi:hypothetical protein